MRSRIARGWVAAMPPPAMGGTPAPGLATATTGMPQPVLALLQSRCSGCHTYGQSDPAGWGSVLPRRTGRPVPGASAR